ncbi:MAG: phosphoglucosamine mutase [Acidimicrobiales bacterium]
MRAPRFGTDGVRGLANQELTPEVAVALGRAAAEVFGAPRFVLGRDTRRSGPMLEAALSAGICAAGADVELLGVVPTPTVAWVAARSSVPGAMISASHNPYADNGIKLFAPGGLKLADEIEARIQGRYLELLASGPSPAAAAPVGAGVGSLAPGSSDDIDGWVDAVCVSIAPRRLDGLRLVVDCAHGAAHELGPRVLRRLGAEVTVIGADPDGVNINDGVGSTAPGPLAEAVVTARADLGVAFDGDADRLIAVDETGDVVDGDRMLAILALDRAARGLLAGNTVVVTVMTNLGFHLAMQRAGIRVVSTSVGDRYVLQALDEGGYSLGGEQSGHVITRDLATTGDGVLSAVQLLDAVSRSTQPLSKLAAESMTTVPQILRNVRLPHRDEHLVEALEGEIGAVTDTLGTDGRVLVRASGTEPLLRVMVEHVDPQVAEQCCDRLVEAAQRLVSGG